MVIAFTGPPGFIAGSYSISGWPHYDGVGEASSVQQYSHLVRQLWSACMVRRALGDHKDVYWHAVMVKGHDNAIYV